MNFYKLKYTNKATFSSPIEASAMPAPTSKLPEEREFVVDSGASIQLSKKDLSSDELETLRRSRTLKVVVTVSGEVQTNEEAEVYVHDLGFFVTVQLFEDALLQSYRLEHFAKNTDIPRCGQAVNNYNWPNKGRQFHAERTTSYFFSIPGVSASSGTASSSASPVQDLPSSSSIAWRSDEPAPGNWREAHQTTKKQNKKKDDNRDSDERLRDLREWLKEFPDNLEDRDACASHISQDTDSEHPTRVVSQSRDAQYLYSLPPKDRNCKVCMRTKMTGVPLQKTHWWCSVSSNWTAPHAEKFGDLITADHQSAQRGRWITKQSSIRCRGARSCHTINSILSVQNQNFSGDGKEFTKVPRAVTEAKSY